MQRRMRLSIRVGMVRRLHEYISVRDDRTGMDIAAYRMAEQGWAEEEAKRQMAAYGVNWFHPDHLPPAVIL